jgi:broad specificity phosphatase PhoE
VKYRRIQGGGSDTELNKTGRMQAEKLGYALRNRNIEAIYSSPLQRALDTATAIARYHNLKVNVEQDLREIDAGEMEGVTLDNLIKDFSHFLIRFSEGNGMGKLPGGESLNDLRQRAWKVVQNILRKHQESAVIVSHYFVTLSIICAALELPLSSVRKMRVRPAGITILNFTESKVTLKVFNDTCHLTRAG